LIILGDSPTLSRPGKYSCINLYSATPSIFWLPAKHNDKTYETLKKT